MGRIRFFIAVLLATAFLNSAPANAQKAGYDLSALNSQVQQIVTSARAAEGSAVAAQTRAREAAQLAEQAAARARAGAAGTTAYDSQPFGDPPRTARYETEFSNNARNGYGVQTYTSGPWAGDRYAGQFVNNVKSGVGVYVYAGNPNNPVHLDRIEAEYAQSFANGYGVITWHTGQHYAGTIARDLRHGSGVLYLENGNRFEGEFSNDVRSGFGVLWDADGQVLSQGVWANGELTTSMSR